MRNKIFSIVITVALGLITSCQVQKIDTFKADLEQFETRYNLNLTQVEENAIWKKINEGEKGIDFEATAWLALLDMHTGYAESQSNLLLILDFIQGAKNKPDALEYVKTISKLRAADR